MTSTLISELDTFGPDRCKKLTYQQAVDYTRRLTEAHSENFSVISWCLPRRLRQDFRNIYAFCRWSDDLGDEAGDPVRSGRLLTWWRSEIDACYRGDPRHPVFVALGQTICRHDIPRKPFDDLVDAFCQDQVVVRYDRWSQVLDYCTRSANPVGRLVLYLCGYRDERRQVLSDATCTALQLANFWQDVRRDILERGRVYIPADVAAKHGLDIETLVTAVRLDGQADAAGSCCSPRRVPGVGLNALKDPFCATVQDLVGRTWPLFRQGRALWPLVRRDVRLDIQLFTLGGESVLNRIKQLGCNTMASRPRLGKTAKLTLVLRALAMNLTGWTGTLEKGAS